MGCPEWQLVTPGHPPGAGLRPNGGGEKWAGDSKGRVTQSTPSIEKADECSQHMIYNPPKLGRPGVLSRWKMDRRVVPSTGEYYSARKRALAATWLHAEQLNE